MRHAERRMRLLALGRDLFARHAYDELSMADIARAAGISKPLLYHYFPSKRRYFEATLREAAGEVLERTRPDPGLAPLDQLRGGLDAFLELVDANRVAYLKLMRSATSASEVRELLEGLRAATAERILNTLPGASSPATRTAVRAWLWFVEGACLEWVEREQLTRDELRDLLAGTLLGALRAAGGEPDPASS
jgi:AcrR family transcriptional regulator